MTKEELIEIARNAIKKADSHNPDAPYYAIYENGRGAISTEESYDIVSRARTLNFNEGKTFTGKGAIGEIPSGMGGIFTIKCISVKDGVSTWKNTHKGWEETRYTYPEAEVTLLIKLQ